MASFFKLLVDLGLNASGYELGMKRAEMVAERFGDKIKEEFTRAFGTVALIEYTKHIVELGAKTVETAERLGISTKTLQEWTYAAKHTGAAAEDVTHFFEKLGRSRDEAFRKKGGMSGYAAMGISEKEVQSLKREEMAARIAGIIKNAANPQDFLGPLVQVGGRGAPRLITAMREGIDELAEAARRAGMILADETLQNLLDLHREALLFADEFVGPASTLITGLAKVARYMKMLLEASGRFVGSFAFDTLNHTGAKTETAYALEAFRRGWSGKKVPTFDEWQKEGQDPTKKKSWSEIFMEAVKSGKSSFEDFQKVEEDQQKEIERRRKMAAARPIPRDMIETPERMKIAITNWQRIGAAVQNPLLNPLTRIEQNTAQIARNTQGGWSDQQGGGSESDGEEGFA